VNKRILHLLLPLCLAALPSCQRILRPAPLGLVVNGDFQNARAGGPPPGWAAFPGTSVDSQGGWAGLRRPCAVIRSQEDPNHAQPMDAVLHQEVNPDPCRGQRVRGATFASTRAAGMGRDRDVATSGWTALKGRSGFPTTWSKGP
jgi:hypothetical protein